MRDYFGYITLHPCGDESDRGRSVRIGDIEIGYLYQQWNSVSYRKGEKTNAQCHIRTDNGYCSTSFTVKESPGEVLQLIEKHDREYAQCVRDYASRNGFTMMKGAPW